jgi:GDP-L-fucose synthase
MTRVFELSGRRVWVAGHSGMVGSAILRALGPHQVELITAELGELDLTRQADVERFALARKPEVVFVAAARVGGILANSTYPVDFLYDNLMIEANVIRAAHQAGARKLLFLGSTCIYPRDADQPIREEALLTGPLEPTNEWYAVAKIAGIKLCQAYRQQYGADFISAMPTNLYGPNDNFDLAGSHVLPALMRKIHDAKIKGQSTVTIWGTGTPRREFMHVDDLARALVFLMEHYSEAQHINVGTGVDGTIGELAQLIATVVGYRGSFEYDRSKPDGMLRKCTDTSRLRALGFLPAIDLERGLRETYAWFLEHRAEARGMT